MKVWIVVCLIGWSASIARAQSDFPSLRRQFPNLPCLAPVIAKIDAEAPTTVEEALSLPPNEAPERLDPRDTGEVHFPFTSTLKDASIVQFWFDQGLGLFHLGAMIEAERCFRQVVALDPDCPMAYWGMMLVNEATPRRAELYLERAMHLASRVQVTKRESAWLRLYVGFYGPSGSPYSRCGERDQSVREEFLRRELESLAFAQPTEVEAKALLLRSQTQRWIAGKRAPELAIGVQALMDTILELSPRHPSQIDVVSLWARFRRELAADAAIRMLSDKFSQPQVYLYASQALKAGRRHAEALAASEMGLRLLHQRSEARRMAPVNHVAYESLVEQHVLMLGSVGKIDEALKWLEVMERTPQLPGADRLPLRPDPRDTFTAWDLAKGRFSLLIRGERWDSLDKVGRAWLQPSQPGSFRMLGCLAWRVSARAQGKPLDEIADPESFYRELLVAGDLKAEARVKGLASAGRVMEDLAAKKGGTMSAGILETYPPEYVVRMLAEAGEKDMALRFAKMFIAENFHAPLITAQMISIMHEIGADDEAMLVFDSAFRKDATLGDPGHPAWARVVPTAKRAGLLERWTLPGRVVALPGMPFENRPKLGPLWWSDQKPVEGELLNEEGVRVALEEMRGAPVLLQFFVGLDCGYCLGALSELGEFGDSLKETGLQVIAISPDTPEVLRTFTKAAEPGKWPFTFLVDPESKLTKAFRMWDGFEKEPMHGTILLDATGKILWTFSGHEPFIEWDLLLSELRRPRVLKALGP